MCLVRAAIIAKRQVMSSVGLRVTMWSESQIESTPTASPSSAYSHSARGSGSPYFHWPKPIPILTLLIVTVSSVSFFRSRAPAPTRPVRWYSIADRFIKRAEWAPVDPAIKRRLRRISPTCGAFKACLFQLLSHGSAHGCLDATALDVLAQRIVDEGLVVAAPHFMDLLAEVI